MSLFSGVRKKLEGFGRGVAATVNMRDGGKAAWNMNPRPVQRPIVKQNPQQDNRGWVSKVYDTANMWDNGRSFAVNKPTTQKSVFQQTAGQAKSIAKPFFETADYAGNSLALGYANATKQRETADELRKIRDESYQQSLVPAAMHTTHTAMQINPIYGMYQGSKEEKAKQRIEEQYQQGRIRQRQAVADEKAGKITSDQRRAIIAGTIEDNNKASADLQNHYTNTMKSIAGSDKNADGTDKTALQAGLSAGGDAINTALMVVNPMSGAALKQGAVEQGTKWAVKQAAKDLVASNVLNATGQVAAGKGQGLTNKQIVDQTLKSSATNTVLMAAGYLKASVSGKGPEVRSIKNVVSDNLAKNNPNYQKLQK